MNLRARYLDLMKKSLTCSQYEGLDGSAWIPNKRIHRLALRLVVPRKVRLSKVTPPEQRAEGRDLPLLAQTMAGLKRLDNLQFCVETVLADNVPGDLIETGVWRGGCSIFMKAILAAHGVTNRTIWVADSFAGLPRPDAEKYPADAGDTFHLRTDLAVSLEMVRGNFERYGLLDDQVRFLKGWFKNTLPSLPAEKLAVIRLDGDMYESTMDGLNHLYPKLQPGGFIIIDDYGCLPSCSQAVQDYRNRHGITEPIETIDWTGAFWRQHK
ncbi:MAG: TylF/MycF family methyltransferase [Limisphaerales bacterium]